MKTIHINSPFKTLYNHIEHSRVNLLSSPNLYDADNICLYISKGNSEPININGRNYRSVEHLNDVIDETRAQINNILTSGKSINIFCSGELKIEVYKQASGGIGVVEARKPITVFDFFDDLPVDIFDRKLTGSNIRLDENVVATNSSFDDLNYLFRYHYIFPEVSKYEPLLRVNTNDFIVGYALPSKKGKLVVLPGINSDSRLIGNDQAEITLANMVATFVQNIEGKLITKAISQPQPDWVSDIKLLNENKLDAERREQLAEVIKAQNDLDKIDRKIDDLNILKKLYYASGDELEESVKFLFERMGFTVLRNNSNRVDLILSYKDYQPIVVEVKGVNGSASESHAAQLEKWASEYFEKTKIIPKGLLVVNTYRNMRKDKRPEINFPDQMLKYMELKNQVGITSIGLLSYLERIELDEIAPDDFYRSIITNNKILNQI